MTPRREKPIYNFTPIVFFSLILFIAHVSFLATAPYDLYADEAQYWSWSKNIDWGYFSKPPMVAWLIAATTKVCGDGIFCVKLGSPIMHFFTSLMVYLIGCRMFSKKVGFWSGIVYGTLPGVTVSSYIISTDPLLLFFWSLALYSFVRAMQDWHIKWWVILGIAVGLGMLSKYTMILFFVSAGIYFLTSKENRLYLFSFKFWLSGLIAGAIYLPNFLWNKSNGFVSYFHTQDNANVSSFDLHFAKMLEFIGAQFGVFGPILFGALLFYTFILLPLLCKKDSYKLLFSFIIPFFALITVISLLSRAHANWAVPIYIPATILVVSLLTANGKFLIKTSVYLNILIAIAFYQFPYISEKFDFELKAKIDPFRRIKGQEEFAEMVKKEHALNHYPTLMTTDRKTHATLLYYLKDKEGNPPYIVKWNGDKDIDDHYDLTTSLDNHLGENFLLITKQTSLGGMSKSFKTTHKTGYITIPLYSDYALEYNVFRLNEFQGYK